MALMRASLRTLILSSAHSAGQLPFTPQKKLIIRRGLPEKILASCTTLNPMESKRKSQFAIEAFFVQKEMKI